MATQRITEAQLQRVVDRINIATGSPTTLYTRNADKTCTPNVGCFFLDMAYGGYKLCRQTGAGCTDITQNGYMPKRELHAMLHVFLRGYESAMQRTYEE